MNGSLSATKKQQATINTLWTDVFSVVVFVRIAKQYPAALFIRCAHISSPKNTLNLKDGGILRPLYDERTFYMIITYYSTIFRKIFFHVLAQFVNGLSLEACNERFTRKAQILERKIKSLLWKNSSSQLEGRGHQIEFKCFSKNGDF